MFKHRCYFSLSSDSLFLAARNLEDITLLHKSNTWLNFIVSNFCSSLEHSKTSHLDIECGLEPLRAFNKIWKVPIKISKALRSVKGLYVTLVGYGCKSSRLQTLFKIP